MQQSGNGIKNAVKSSIILRKIRIKLITGDLSDVENMIKGLENSKAWLNDLFNRSVLLLLKGEYMYRRGNYKKAMECYEQASVLKEDIGDRTGYASCIMNAGNMLNRMNQPMRAIEYYDRAISIYREFRQETKAANATINKLSVMIKINPETEVSEYEMLENIFLKNNMYRSLVTLYEIMASFMQINGQADKADHFLNKGMDIAKEINDIYNYSNIYLKKGVFAYLRGEKRKSIENFMNGLNVLEHYEGFNQLKVILNYNIADVYSEIDHREKALPYYKYVYEHDENRSDMYDEANDFLKNNAKEER